MRKQILIFTILFLFSAITVTAQQRPLLTEDVDTTPAGSIEIAAGVDFFQNDKFPLSGLTGDLTRVGNIRLSVGVNSNIEIQYEGTIRNFLAINTATNPAPIPLNVVGNSTSDVGDITVATKVRIRNETKNIPGIAFQSGFQIPNTDQARGIGTNQINLFTKLIVQKTFAARQNKLPRAKVFGNLGVGIQTAPLERFTQNDVLLYGLAGIYSINDRINLVADVNGQVSTRSGDAPLGTESKGQFRIGTQIKASGLRFDTAAILGLTKYSPRSGITFGVTYQSPSIFTPVQ
jgi:hypothetical protein